MTVKPPLYSPKLTESDHHRLWERVRKGEHDKCWPWTATQDRDGYGVIDIDKKQHRVHRLMYFMSFGPFNSSLYVCHRCDVPSCVNPAHLFLGTNDDNMADMVSKGRQARGEGQADAKLTNNLVQNVRADYETGRYTMAELAERYDLGRSTVGRIVRGESWKHIELGYDPQDIDAPRNEGERSGAAILNEESVREMRQMHATGNFTFGELGKRYGVGKETARMAVSGESWAHIPQVHDPKSVASPGNRGERHGNTRLTESQVREMRSLYSAGWKQHELAARYSINRATVSYIVLRKTWKHVGEDA